MIANTEILIVELQSKVAELQEKLDLLENSRCERDVEIMAKTAHKAYMACSKDFDLDRPGTYMNGWSVRQLADFYVNKIKSDRL